MQLTGIEAILIYVVFSYLFGQFFPEANEVQFARKSVFGGASFKLDSSMENGDYIK